MANTYTLTIQDAHTRQSITGPISGEITLREAVSMLEREGKLSIPLRRACIPGWGSMPQDGQRKLEQTLGAEALRAGMPLMIYLQEVMEDRLRASGAARRLFQEYPLVFFRKYDGVCIQRIDFVCFGFEQPEDIVVRMEKEGKLDRYRYRIVSSTRIIPWDYFEEEVKHPGFTFHKQIPRCLCEINPKPGTVFILEEEKREIPPNVCLYGCPRADMPEQQIQLQNRKVDVICYGE